MSFWVVNIYLIFIVLVLMRLLVLHVILHVLLALGLQAYYLIAPVVIHKAISILELQCVQYVMEHAQVAQEYC